MSLNSAMYAGVCGINAYGDAMNVIGDNIANVNTVGLSPTGPYSADILANSVANGATVMQFGRGALINEVSAQFAQESFETTGNATDIATQGAGFLLYAMQAPQLRQTTIQGLVSSPLMTMDSWLTHKPIVCKAML